MAAPVARRGFTADAVNELIARRAEPAWMQERRRAAWETYTHLPMPTRQDEEWRRTDISKLKLREIQPLAESDAPAAQSSLLHPSEHAESFAGVLGLRDGARVEYRLSEAAGAQGVVFLDLASALQTHGDLLRDHFMTRVVPPGDSKFAALHGAFWQNGTLLYVPRGVMLADAFRVLVSADLRGRASLSHTLIVLEAGAQATLAEDFLSADVPEQGFASRVVEILVGQDASLRYIGTQRWGRAVYDVHTERMVLGKGAQATLHTVELGSGLSKGRVEAILAEEGANARLRGLYICDGTQHLDCYTLQDHRAPNGVSDLLFKGVLTDEARSVYSGLIRVLPEGRGTAAYQQNRNLLLSRSARADSIPNLEIGANDIIGCSHGATVGKVDEEQIFYLMCRGLSRVEATRLIVEGFVDPIIEEIAVAPLRETLRLEVQERVGAAQTSVVHAG